MIAATHIAAASTIHAMILRNRAHANAA